MTIAYDVTMRNARLDEITAAIDAGAGAGLLRIYDGVRPATGGAVTTLLSEHAMSDPSFPAAAAGTMTANAIADETSAPATGTATWFRVVDSDFNFVMDGDVGDDLILNTADITTGVNVAINSFVINEGNP